MRRLFTGFILFLGLYLSVPGFAAVNLSKIEGNSVLGTEQLSLSSEGKKAIVVVFLSAKCPCSNSHVAELKSLAKDYPDVKFVGVNSNLDESPELAKSYFEKVGLGFPVIKDNQTILADRYSALKTPHAFVLNGEGKILYQGGVSSSQRFENADRKYLRQALTDIHEGRAVKMTEGRTLGCVISRGDKNVW